VKLNMAPSGTVEVAVSWAGGDGDITVASGANLTFTPGNWSEWQPVGLEAAQDADTAGGAATVTCTAAGHTPASVTATEQEDDFAPLRINCGGSAVAPDWVADTGYSGGTAYSTSQTIQGVPSGVPQAVYQRERCAPVLAYNFPAVPDGVYTVRLHYVEFYFTRQNQRVFNVDIEGQRVLTGLDMVAQAGGRYRALVKEFRVEVSDGNGLQIAAQATKSDAKFGGIEVIEAPVSLPAASATRLWTGAAAP
jgi:hypothetical protein